VLGEAGTRILTQLTMSQGRQLRRRCLVASLRTTALSTYSSSKLAQLVCIDIKYNNVLFQMMGPKVDSCKSAHVEFGQGLDRRLRCHRELRHLAMALASDYDNITMQPLPIDARKRSANPIYSEIEHGSGNS
jgi:hypothetical protein